MRLFKIFLIIFLFSSHVESSTDYFQEGLIFFEKKEFEKAKFKFEQDIVYNPKSENSYLYLAKIFNKQKKNNLEKKNLNTVILLNPKHEEANYNLAKLRLNESDFKGSKEIVEQLLVFCKIYCQQSKELKAEIEKSIKK